MIIIVLEEIFDSIQNRHVMSICLCFPLEGMQLLSQLCYDYSQYFCICRLAKRLQLLFFRGLQKTTEVFCQTLHVVLHHLENSFQRYVDNYLIGRGE